ncbi:endonuclease domain-containing protein [Bacillus infantis]|uniref:endonuclease domain-containing protein n=1 Tax=Bacillus infantis TaxID=324767 RepID=UPI003CEAF5CA
MIDYIVFFGLLLLALLAFIFRPKHEQELSPAAAQRAKCESPIERRLFDALTARGYDVNAQVKCGPYCIDLALIAYKIAIECDGREFHSSPEAKKRDRRKDAYLRKNGWIVLRFTGKQINKELPKVLGRIEKELYKYRGE